MSDLLLLELSFFILDPCDLYVLLTVSILFFYMGGVMAYFTTLGFVPMSLIPSLAILSVVVTNNFLEDMISLIDLLYPVNYKTKVIVLAILISV